MKIDIDKLTEAALIDLNNRIVERLKFLQQMRAHAAMLDYSIGERVSFQPAGHPLLTGIISKYNKKPSPSSPRMGSSGMSHRRFCPRCGKRRGVIQCRGMRLTCIGSSGLCSLIGGFGL